eukprot:TRINITY_DN8933_c0_g3_i1.p7 TRINITY_DN8933_c0_g3~~TRINITY_DN8933_c0_g3_i1.p7  ORF type:complete len:119 (-),score=1.46 TRINITY_DN8933_c0_g3_i1:650-1006(-)
MFTGIFLEEVLLQRLNISELFMLFYIQLLEVTCHLLNKIPECACAWGCQYGVFFGTILFFFLLFLRFYGSTKQSQSILDNSSSQQFQFPINSNFFSNLKSQSQDFGTNPDQVNSNLLC